MSARVIIPGESEGAEHAGGVHKRPPIPDNSLKAECPKFMAHGPCGGVRKGGLCEVYPEMKCPWVSLYIELEKIGQTEWMKQVLVGQRRYLPCSRPRHTGQAIYPVSPRTMGLAPGRTSSGS